MTDALTKVSDILRDSSTYSNKSRKPFLIFTPNPEFIVLAQEDKEFKDTLNLSDLNIPDGAGLKLTGEIKNQTTGVDLMEKLCELAAKKNWTVGLLGGKEGVAKKTAEVLTKRYPGLHVIPAKAGIQIDETGSPIGPGTTNAWTDKVDILFVAFGQGKQEKWIYRNRSKVSSKVMMGVGGSFDYIGGFAVRAPKWIRALGLEWFFRLLMQPRRAKRQLKLLRFIWLILTKN